MIGDANRDVANVADVLDPQFVLRVVHAVRTRDATYPVTVDPTWSTDAKLTASRGFTGDCFGASVALDGDTAIIGAYNAGFGANTQRGSVYVFERSDSSWRQITKLTASDGSYYGRFGSSVALDGETVIIWATTDGDDRQGAAYIFERSGCACSEVAKLIAVDGVKDNSFGDFIALNGDTGLVGTYVMDVGGNTRLGR